VPAAPGGSRSADSIRGRRVGILLSCFFFPLDRLQVAAGWIPAATGVAACSGYIYPAMAPHHSTTSRAEPSFFLNPTPSTNAGSS